MLFSPPTLKLAAVHKLVASVALVGPTESGISSTGRMDFLGTGTHAIANTDARTAPGWLSVRHLALALVKRMLALGTELAVFFESMVRTAPGWLSVRPSQIFYQQWDQKLGTAHDSTAPAEVCTAPGWLSVQTPISFSEAACPNDYHLPVFPREITAWMEAGEGKFIIDGTLGGGGHSELFLSAGAHVLGIDRDPEALAHARTRLAKYRNQFSTWEGNFAQMRHSPAIKQGKLADGLLLDLGVSSRQLDSASRGFSFMREGPLDMRMGPSCPRTAADIVNQWPETEIMKILYELGEESKARRIAAAIVTQRAEKPFVTTLDLATCVERAIGRQGRTHPATRTFQAIRMAVNEELESLSMALNSITTSLKPEGRLLIITFHSLEDRIVKRFLKHHSSPFLDDPSWPEARSNPDYHFRLLAKKAIHPSALEISQNPRSRSAKLRVAQLLANPS